MNLHGITTMTPVAHMFDASTAGAGSTAAAGSSTAAGSGNSSTNAADQAESTFISLLVTELQSQDPTQPMDPTTMVGQMFSMNELEQLININQTLSTAFGTGTTGTSGSTPSGTGNSSANQLLIGAN